MLIQINTHIRIHIFSLPDSSMGKNAIIFEANMSSSVYINNKGKNILILGERVTK